MLPALCPLPLSASLSGDKASRAVWAPVTREKIIKKMTLARPWRGRGGGTPENLTGDINRTETGSTTFPEKGQSTQHLASSAIRWKKVTSRALPGSDRERKPRKTPTYTFAPHHSEASAFVGGPQRLIRSPFTVLKIQLREDLDGKRMKQFVILSTQLAPRGQRRTN